MKQGGDLIDHDDSKSIVSGEIPKTQAGTVNSGVGSVEELEKLLGAYFVQIGSTLNKLSMVRNLIYINQIHQLFDKSKKKMKLCSC